MSRTNALGQILCYGCNNPIHVTQFAGAVNVNGQSEFFCNSLPCLLTIADLEGGEEMQQEAEVTKQEVYRVKIDDLSLQHTTLTKKNKVSIQRYGSKIGTVKFDDIDNLVELLLTLKEQVNENV